MSAAEFEQMKKELGLEEERQRASAADGDRDPTRAEGLVAEDRGCSDGVAA